MSSESNAGRRVILCDQAGEPTGTCGIVAAHQGEGRLHKAFSVFVFRQIDHGWALLLQQRSEHKTLFGCYWANTCCSHPRPSDDGICQAGERRLKEELGFTLSLDVAGSFVYRATDDRTGGTEYEHDTVLVGQAKLDVQVRTDPREIRDHKWVTLDELRLALKRDEHEFAPWFRPGLSLALRALGLEGESGG